VESDFLDCVSRVSFFKLNLFEVTVRSDIPQILLSFRQSNGTVYDWRNVVEICRRERVTGAIGV